MQTNKNIKEKVQQIEAKAILKLRVEAQYLNPLLKNLSLKEDSLEKIHLIGNQN